MNTELHKLFTIALLQMTDFEINSKFILLISESKFDTIN